MPDSDNDSGLRMTNSFRLKKKRQNMQQKATCFLIAPRVAVALMLVATLAMGGACSAPRSSTGKALRSQSAELSGTYAARQDAAPGQHPTCCAGCARTVVLPAAILSCSQEDPASEPVKADPNAVITVSEMFLSSFSDANPQPFHHVPPIRPRPFIINCVLLC